MSKKLILVGMLCLALVSLGKTVGLTKGGEVRIIELEGPINPGAAAFLTRGLEDAEKQGVELIIIRLDTPGGLVPSMRTMVKGIMNSAVPVVVYVSPKGAGAA
ncbi:MAG: nodulation protein NfeD, partial [Deltaproteobacteria bacterium]|nr:nodulation protein NfeD [Deltaproteobacteria bacterium]